MAIFSPKARRFVETAVSQLPDNQRQIWDAWSRANPDIRRAGDPTPQFQDFPSDAAMVALDALERMSSALSRTLAVQALDEDEACDMEGDISFINAVKAMLIAEIERLRAEV